jgi:hypothetical protein
MGYIKSGYISLISTGDVALHSFSLNLHHTFAAICMDVPRSGIKDSTSTAHCFACILNLLQFVAGNQGQILQARQMFSFSDDVVLLCHTGKSLNSAEETNGRLYHRTGNRNGDREYARFWLIGKLFIAVSQAGTEDDAV